MTDHRVLVARIRPLADHELPEQLAAAAARQRAVVGLLPDSFRTMARRPRMAELFAELAAEVLGPGRVEVGLKRLVAAVSSVAAGCRYCQAHAAHGAELAGVDDVKLRHVFDFETSGHFSERERAVLRLARDASIVPNDVTDADFDQLRTWFDDDELVEILGVIALYGWLNRWNDTVATALEAPAAETARRTLGPEHWQSGKHGSARPSPATQEAAPAKD